MDDMEEVTQRFEADVTEYVDEVNRAADDSKEFAEAALGAKAAVAELRDGAAEAAPALGRVRDETLEAARAVDAYRDAEGRWRDSSGRFVSAAEREALGLGHVRDEALEAAAAVKRLKDEEQRSSGSPGLPGGNGGKGGAGGMLANLPAWANPLVWLAALPAVMAVVTEVGALATGLTAAGLGVAGFAALAMPALKSVTGAYAQINADHQAYNRALTATARNTALAHLRQDWAALDPAQRGAVQGIQQFTGEYRKIVKAFEPTAFRVFSEAIAVANKLLPYLSGFANAAAPAIEGLLTGLGKWLDTQQVQSFLEFMQYLSGPVITAIGSGMKGLAIDVFILMERFSKKDVINSINIAFRVLGTALGLVIGLIMESQMAWDWLTMAALPAVAKAFDATRHAVASFGHGVAQTFDTVRHGVSTSAHDIEHDFDTVRHAAAWLGHEIAHALDDIRHDIAQWAGDVRHDTDMVISFFAGLPHRIVTGLGDLGHLLWNAGLAVLHGFLGGLKAAWNDVTGFVGGIGSWISAHKGPIEADALLLVPHGMAIMRGLMGGIASQLPALRSQLAGVTGAIPASVGIGGGHGLGGGSYGASASSLHVTVPLTLTAGTQGYSDPRFLQYLQQVVQEAILRYGLNNPGNGLSLAGRL